MVWKQRSGTSVRQPQAQWYKRCRRRNCYPWKLLLKTPVSWENVRFFGKRKKVEGTFWAEDRWNFSGMYNELKGNSERFSGLGRDGRWGWVLWDSVKWGLEALHGDFGNERAACVHTYIFIHVFSKFKCWCRTHYLCDCNFNDFTLSYLIFSTIKLGFLM